MYHIFKQTEIISFSEKSTEFAAINAQVLAISTDSHHTHLAWSRHSRADGGVGKLNIPLVADTSKTISASYGVLVTDENDDMYGAALRGLFIIGTNMQLCNFCQPSRFTFGSPSYLFVKLTDPTGTIRTMQINDDQVGRSVEETLRLVKAFQYADSHVGEACPASWTPGSDTIKTNPNDSKEYFKAHYIN